MQSRALPLALVVALAASSVACMTSTPPTPPEANKPSTCSSDGECAAGFKCDREQRRCVCTGDQACPAGKFCNAFSGTCVDTVGGCTSDSVCKPGEFCDGLSLARIGGAYAWRTRVSEARHRLQAEGRGDIANTLTRWPDGRVQSLYTFVPAAQPSEGQQEFL